VAWLGAEDIAVGGHSYVFKHDQNAKYMAYMFRTRMFYNHKKKYATGAKVIEISGDNIAKFSAPIPSLDEQERVVSILDKYETLVNELSTNVSTEIETRRKQYGYYLNQLLTPVKINGKWYLNGKEVECKALGEIGNFTRGSGLQKKDFRDSGVGCIHYGQIHTFYDTYTDKTLSFVTEEHAKRLKKAKKGDLIIAAASEDVEGVCKAVAWLGDEDIAVSGDTFIFDHNQNAKYIAYLFRAVAFYKHKQQYATGTKVIRVSETNIAKFSAPIPSLDEQERIVSILDKYETLVNELSTHVSYEIEARQRQFDYYLNKLLSFDNIADKKDE
jgi:type I restriction enzyme S subunit